MGDPQHASQLARRIDPVYECKHSDHSTAENLKFCIILRFVQWYVLY
jgi:hypothetical protein